MKPTEEQLKRLADCIGDDEKFHSVFDAILEERLMELDPEWMKAMSKLYTKSGMFRFFA